MVRQGSAKPSSTSSNLVVTSKRFPEASASGIFCFYQALFLRSTLQRTFAVLQGALPGVSSNAWPVLSATAVDYVLLKNAPLSPVYACRDSRTQLKKTIVAYIDYYYRRIK